MSHHLFLLLFFSFIKASALFASPQSSNYSLSLPLLTGVPVPYFFHGHLGFFPPSSSSCLGPSPPPLPLSTPHGLRTCSAPAPSPACQFQSAAGKPSGTARPRESKQRAWSSQSARRCSPPWASAEVPLGSHLQSGWGAGSKAGRWGRGREARVPFLMKRVTSRKGTQLQASASSTCEWGCKADDNINPHTTSGLLWKFNKTSMWQCFGEVPH